MIAKLKTRQETEKAELANRLELQNKAVMASIVERLQMDKQEKQEMENMLIEIKRQNDLGMARLAQTIGHDK